MVLTELSLQFKLYDNLIRFHKAIDFPKAVYLPLDMNKIPKLIKQYTQTLQKYLVVIYWFRRKTFFKEGTYRKILSCLMKQKPITEITQ